MNSRAGDPPLYALTMCGVAPHLLDPADLNHLADVQRADYLDSGIHGEAELATALACMHGDSKLTTSVFTDLGSSL